MILVMQQHPAHVTAEVDQMKAQADEEIAGMAADFRQGLEAGTDPAILWWTFISKLSANENLDRHNLAMCVATAVLQLATSGPESRSRPV
jgi:hypothetical protein